MTKVEDEHFLLMRDIELGEDLKLGPPSMVVIMEEVGQWVRSALVWTAIQGAPTQPPYRAGKLVVEENTGIVVVYEAGNMVV